VQHKGSGAVAVMRTVTHDAQTGAELSVNEFTMFAVGVGRFEGSAAPLARPAAATAPNVPPPRPPDAVLRLQTTKDQAALYRCGCSVTCTCPSSPQAACGWMKTLCTD
jgi:hypothetical protein